MMEGDPAACLRSCVNKGSKYALVVGDKVYTLDSSDPATLDALAKLGAQKATVKGTVDGDTITVSRSPLPSRPVCWFPTNRAPRLRAPREISSR